MSFFNNNITESVIDQPVYLYLAMRAPSKTMGTRQQYRDVCVGPNHRYFDYSLTNINNKNSNINELLSYVKNKTHKPEQQQLSLSQGFNNYKLRINYLQDIQKRQDIQMAEQIMQMKAIQKQNIGKQNSIKFRYHYDCIQSRQQNLDNNWTIQYQEKLKIKSALDQDSMPISKPSAKITKPPQNQAYLQPRRSKSPLSIQRPNSKYIKNYALLSNNSNNQIELQTFHPSAKSNNAITRHVSAQKQQQYSLFKGQLFNEGKKQRQKSYVSDKPHINYPLTLTQRINQQKQIDSFQSRKIKEPQQKKEQLSFQNQAKQQIKTQPNRNQKQRDFHQQLYKSKQQNAHIGNGNIVKFIQSQIQFHEQPNTQKQQFNAPYRSEFQIKVYPCNLDKDTIKSYVADHLAEVVKVDSQLLEYKKMLLENSFNQKLSMSAKKSAMVDSFRKRGLFIQLEDIQSIIDFELSNQTALFSPEIRHKFKNFNQFVQQFVDKYLQAEYEWEKKVLNMLTKNQIELNLFKVSKLDLQKKGYLKLQDLTCFINLYASHSPCFKNKSVKLLFSRFCRGHPDPDRLTYEGFMQKIIKG